jgi:8-oxo-dGTP pyrophosphatase MutT (NUDIX family)
MKPGSIRVLALGIIWRGDELLLMEGYDPAKRQTFYRPLGGGVEFGEPGRDALIREFNEELGAELANICYLGTLEISLPSMASRDTRSFCSLRRISPMRRSVDATIW